MVYNNIDYNRFISFALQLTGIGIEDYGSNENSILSNGYIFENTGTLATGMRALIVLYLFRSLLLCLVYFYFPLTTQIF